MLAPAAALIAALAAAAGPAAGGPPVAVAAAANLKPALEELAAAFAARHPGPPVRATYGGSGVLAAQIAGGAPFDLFLSADEAAPAQLAARGLADGAPFTYAQGELVVWTPAGSPLDLPGRGLAALLDPRAGRVAVPNPETAPYGRAAREALQRAGLWEALRDRVVTGQSVAQAASFAASGNAGAAFLPRSLAAAPPLDQLGRSWPVPAASHAPILQAGAVLKASRAPARARAFADFLLSAEGQAILARHGYRPPPG